MTSTEVVEAEDVMVVEAYLRPDAAEQQVFVYRTLPGDGGALRVDGAAITLTDGTGAVLDFSAAAGSRCGTFVVLSADSAGSCYLSDSMPGFVVPGHTYTVEVEAPDGRRLVGTTIVPGAFEMVHPAADTCAFPAGNVELTWTASSGAWSYQASASFTGLADGLAALGVEDPPDSLELLGLAIGQSDTTIVFPSEFGVFDRFTLERDVALALQQGLPAGAAADIVVAAGDRNYVNWVRGGNFNPSGQVRVPSVTGDGTGVVASLVAHRRTIVSDTTRAAMCE